MAGAERQPHLLPRRNTRHDCQGCEIEYEIIGEQAEGESVIEALPLVSRLPPDGGKRFGERECRSMRFEQVQQALRRGNDELAVERKQRQRDEIPGDKRQDERHAQPPPEHYTCRGLADDLCTFRMEAMSDDPIAYARSDTAPSPGPAR